MCFLFLEFNVCFREDTNCNAHLGQYLDIYIWENNYWSLLSQGENYLTRSLGDNVFDKLTTYMTPGYWN